MLSVEQIAYMENTPNFVQGTKCLELELPWICKDAVYWLDKHLKKEYTCLEFGSGGSTLFLKKRIRTIHTYEADKRWYEDLKTNYSSNDIEYNYVKDHGDVLNCIQRINKNYYDVCFVDIGEYNGRNREEIFLKCIPKMKSNTIYVLDNGLSKHHYFNIYKWKLEDFQNVLGSHYKLIDFDEPSNQYASTRILYTE